MPGQGRHHPPRVEAYLPGHVVGFVADGADHGGAHLEGCLPLGVEALIEPDAVAAEIDEASRPVALRLHLGVEQPGGATGGPGPEAVTLPHHNGRTEGVNNKTKMIKRQMYGRAGFTLLRHRILLG